MRVNNGIKVEGKYSFESGPIKKNQNLSFIRRLVQKMVDERRKETSPNVAVSKFKLLLQVK